MDIMVVGHSAETQKNLNRAKMPSFLITDILSNEQKYLENFLNRSADRIGENVESIDDRHGWSSTSKMIANLLSVFSGSLQQYSNVCDEFMNSDEQPKQVDADDRMEDVSNVSSISESRFANILLEQIGSAEPHIMRFSNWWNKQITSDRIKLINEHPITKRSSTAHSEDLNRPSTQSNEDAYSSPVSTEIFSRFPEEMHSERNEPLNDADELKFSHTGTARSGANSALDALIHMTSSSMQHLGRKQNGLATDAVNHLDVECLSHGTRLTKRRKTRTTFSNSQLTELEHSFNRQKYLTPSDRDRIAKQLGLSNTQVITWFQNRRAKLKREAEELERDLLAARQQQQEQCVFLNTQFEDRRRNQHCEQKTIPSPVFSDRWKSGFNSVPLSKGAWSSRKPTECDIVRTSIDPHEVIKRLMNFTEQKETQNISERMFSNKKQLNATNLQEGRMIKPIWRPAEEC